MAATQTWTDFERRVHEIADLGSVEALLDWDDATYCPDGSHEARGSLTSTIAAIKHERIADPAYGELLDQLGSDVDLDEGGRAMVRISRRTRDRAVRLPESLVRRLAEQATRTSAAWERARKESDFALYQPELERMMSLKLEEIDAVGFEDDPYDALLDEYEPGLRVATLTPLLDALRDRLVPFVAEVLERPAPEAGLLHGPFDAERQLAFTRRVVSDFGFDFEHGRQDLSTHPFCTSFTSDDVRLTTRVYESLEPGALFSSMHEAGHGLYEQGLPGQYARTPVANAPSLGIHESQSRFWENVLGRSLAFWEHYLPILREHFPGSFDETTPDQIWRASNKVERTPIRVDADELTYNLHVMLRYELELDLVHRRLEVADLPEAWRGKMEAYVGFTPRNDLEGVMQDVHWAFGGVGYFSTYTLGNLYSAAIADAMRKDVDIDAQLRAGDFAPILGWLRERIHSQGYLRSTEELLADVTGRPLGIDAWLDYATAKYSDLYDLA